MAYYLYMPAKLVHLLVGKRFTLFYVIARVRHLYTTSKTTFYKYRLYRQAQKNTYSVSVYIYIYVYMGRGCNVAV